MGRTSGWFAVHRRIFEHELFADEPFSKREAWLWMVAEAKHRPESVTTKRGPRVDLARGQFVHSLDFLANAWGWQRTRVRRFLDRLEEEEMIRRSDPATGSQDPETSPPEGRGSGTTTGTKTGTTNGTKNGTRSGTLARLITICNYDKFQSAVPESGTTTGTKNGTTTGTKNGTTTGPKREQENNTNNTTRQQRAHASQTPPRHGTEPRQWYGWDHLPEGIGDPDDLCSRVATALGVDPAVENQFAKPQPIFGMLNEGWSIHEITRAAKLARNKIDGRKRSWNVIKPFLGEAREELRSEERRKVTALVPGKTNDEALAALRSHLELFLGCGEFRGRVPGHWPTGIHHYGERPGQEGCKVPQWMLAEYGERVQQVIAALEADEASAGLPRRHHQPGKRAGNDAGSRG